MSPARFVQGDRNLATPSAAPSSAGSETPETYKLVGRILGPALFLLMLLTEQWQGTMSTEAWRAAGVGIWMAVWWATEAIPVPVTAFLPLVVFEPLGITSLRSAAEHYAHPTIYLFFGGFLMAIAIERWNLHRRIALAILDRTGTNGRRLVGGFMFVCAMLSMWITNTSTTLMLLPIVLSVIRVIRDNLDDLSEKQHRHFQIAMLLGLAYAASIGGLATLVGTPPNALLIGFLAENYGLEISFARWMAVGIPVTFLMLPAAWLVLTRLLFQVEVPENAAVRAHLRGLRRQLGPMSVPERRVAGVFFLLVLSWMFRQPVTDALGITGVSDAGIVMTAAVLLFILPNGGGEGGALMTWEDAVRIPWGVLILFGGGLSLAAAVSDTGLALWLGERLAPLHGIGLVVLVLAAVTLVIFMTELTSNLATTATLLPVMGAIAVQAGLPPLYLTVPITIAASCAFMLPVATPPNAIVFATGEVTIPQMVRAGLALNLIGIVIVTVIALFVAPAVLV